VSPRTPDNIGNLATWQLGNTPAQHTTLATPDNTRQKLVIPDSGELTSLDISENRLYAAGTMLLAEALKGNQIMTALNISSNRMTYDGVAALADAMPSMGAMTSLNLASNMLGVEGAKIIAACLPKCT
jgi:Ran GTPase-activating protein (RanGAP) involved in mRNA processing and transport